MVSFPRAHAFNRAPLGGYEIETMYISLLGIGRGRVMRYREVEDNEREIEYRQKERKRKSGV